MTCWQKAEEMWDSTQAKEQMIKELKYNFGRPKTNEGLMIEKAAPGKRNGKIKVIAWIRKSLPLSPSFPLKSLHTHVVPLTISLRSSPR